MGASYIARIEGRDSAYVHRWLGLAGEPDVTNHARSAERSRSAERIVKRGDLEWARNGAWPFVVIPEIAREGAAPSWAWWEDDTVLRALTVWIDDGWQRAWSEERELERELARVRGRNRRAAAALATNERVS